METTRSSVSDRIDVQFTPEMVFLNQVALDRNLGRLMLRDTRMFVHFLTKVYDGPKPVRVLDVGANPDMLHQWFMYKQEEAKGGEIPLFYEVLFGNKFSKNYCSEAFIGVASLLENCICVGCDVTTPVEDTKWLNASFVQGDFLEGEVRNAIYERLGGYPHVISGNSVFVKDLGDYQTMKEYPCNGNPNTLGARLATEAWNFLSPQGYLWVANGVRDAELDRPQLPNLVRYKAARFVYRYENLPAVRIYQK